MKTTNPKEYTDLIEVFRIGLNYEILTEKEVAAWADKIILQDEEPDYLIIELSLCQQPDNNVLALLDEFIGQARPTISGRVAFGLLYKKFVNKEIPIRTLMLALFGIPHESNLTEGEKTITEEIYNWYGLGDILDSTNEEDSIVVDADTLQKIEEAILKYLEIYNSLQLDNFKEWKLLDKQIDDKLKFYVIERLNKNK